MTKNRLPRPCLGVAAALGLAACAEMSPPEETGARGPAGFQPIPTEAEFRETVVGRTLTYPGGDTIVVEPGGSLSGRIGGAEVRGLWEWVEGRYCRELVVGDQNFGALCQRPEVAGEVVRFRNPGGGYSNEARLG